MATLKTFKAVVKPNNKPGLSTSKGSFDVTVQAQDSGKARKMLEGQYGRGKVEFLREVR